MTVPLVVVCGLAAELKIARGGRGEFEVIAGGGDPSRIISHLDNLKPVAVLSFGIAGGLTPDFSAGAVRVADFVVMPNGRRLETERIWSAALAAAVETEFATFAGAEAPVTEPHAKAQLHSATGAVFVDMESHIVGAWAATHSARFAALRVVTDSAARALPHAAAVGMRADGRVDLPAILISLIRNPAQLPALIRTGLDARTAFAELLRCRQRLGPRFALLDLG